MNKLIIALVIIMVVVVGWSALKSPSELKDDAAVMPPIPVVTEVMPAPETNAPSVPTVHQITVTASNFRFDPAEIRVKQGDTIRLTLVNSSGTHDWRVDEFAAGTKVLKGDQQETIEFVASRAGTFEYYCSVGTHRQMGMVGSLIVE